MILRSNKFLESEYFQNFGPFIEIHCSLFSLERTTTTTFSVSSHGCSVWNGLASGLADSQLQWTVTSVFEHYSDGGCP